MAKPLAEQRWKGRQICMPENRTCGHAAGYRCGVEITMPPGSKYTGRMQCTRGKGHKGNHIACDLGAEPNYHNYVIWRKVSTPTPVKVVKLTNPPPMSRPLMVSVDMAAEEETCTADDRKCTDRTSKWCDYAMGIQPDGSLPMVCTRPKGHDGRHMACYPSSRDQKSHDIKVSPDPAHICSKDNRLCQELGAYCAHDMGIAEAGCRLICTRKPGHEGPHVACNSIEHNMKPAHCDLTHKCTAKHRLCVKKDDDMCYADMVKGFVCTRADGHDGNHIACHPSRDEDDAHNLELKLEQPF